MKFHKKVFYFLLIIPVVFLTYEVRTTLIEAREAQEELFLLNAQRASNQRTIMGLQVRMLHYLEGHDEMGTAACPLCFQNMIIERYDHELITKFLKENGLLAPIEDKD
jgi:hypothetical protein